MYLRKIRPRTTCLYSAASMCPRSLSAACPELLLEPERGAVRLAGCFAGLHADRPRSLVLVLEVHGSAAADCPCSRGCRSHRRRESRAAQGDPPARRRSRRRRRSSVPARDEHVHPNLGALRASLLSSTRAAYSSSSSPRTCRRAKTSTGGRRPTRTPPGSAVRSRASVSAAGNASLRLAPSRTYQAPLLQLPHRRRRRARTPTLVAEVERHQHVVDVLAVEEELAALDALDDEAGRLVEPARGRRSGRAREASAGARRAHRASAAAASISARPTPAPTRGIDGDAVHRDARGRSRRAAVARPSLT